MTIDANIRDGDLQFRIYREAAEVSVWLSGKICKNEYLTGEVKLPSNQSQMIENAKFAHFLLEKALEKQA